MSLIKKLAGQTIIYGVGSILPKVLNLIVLLPYLTRIFGDDRGEYGIHGIMYTFAGFVIMMITFRMETALFRFGSKTEHLEKTFSTAFTSIFVITVISITAIYWQSEFIANILTKAGDQQYVKYIALICFFDILSALPFARLRLENKAFKFSAIKVISIVINIAVMIFLLEILPNLELSWVSFQSDQKLAYVFIANVVGSAATFLMLSGEISKNKWSIDKPLFGKMFRYAWPLVIVGVAGLISTILDRWLINTYSIGTEDQNETATGLYSAAVKFAVIMQLFIQAFNYASEPFFFKQADSKDAPQTYADVARVFTLVGSLAFLFILFYLDVLQLILDEGFRGGLRVIPILLLAYLFLGLYYNFSVWFKIKDKTKVGAIIAVIGAVISVAINIYLIPRMGIIASAWAALATFSSYAIMGYFAGRIYYPIPYRMDKIMGMIGLAVGFYYVSEWLIANLSLELTARLVSNSLLLLIYCAIIGIWEKSFYNRIFKS